MCTVADYRFPGARRLNLDCGDFKKDGYMNTNKYAHLTPDVLHEIEVFPYLFPDNRFALITAEHVLEHL